jgi:ABC-type transporter Mla MlaB component
MTQRYSQQRRQQWQRQQNLRQTQYRWINAMDTQVIGAVLAGCFSVLVALIHTMKKENRKDHGIVHQSLGRIEQKIDGHVEDHD